MSQVRKIFCCIDEKEKVLRNVLRRLDAQGDSYREKAEIIRAKGKNSSPKELEKLQQLQEAIENINNQRDALQLERKKKVKDLSPEEYQNWQYKYISNANVLPDSTPYTILFTCTDQIADQ